MQPVQIFLGFHHTFPLNSSMIDEHGKDALKYYVGAMSTRAERIG